MAKMSNDDEQLKADAAKSFLTKMVDPAIYNRNNADLAFNKMLEVLSGKSVSENKFTPIKDTLDTEKKYLVSERDLFMLYDAGMSNIDSDGCRIDDPLKDFNHCLSNFRITGNNNP